MIHQHPMLHLNTGPHLPHGVHETTGILTSAGVNDEYILTSADEHVQTSGPRTWRPPLPRPAGGPDAAGAARRVARAGRAAIRRQHLPSRRAREVSVLVWRAHIPDTYAASGPGSATWKDPDPRRRSSRGS